MNEKLQAWRAAGKHLPPVLKDFHDQVALFEAMHEMLGAPDSGDTIKRPSLVEGQCYVIDCFLWFMARHGYTLQRSRAPLAFDSLADNIKSLEACRRTKLTHALRTSSPDAGSEPEDAT